MLSLYTLERQSKPDIFQLQKTMSLMLQKMIRKQKRRKDQINNK